MTSLGHRFLKIAMKWEDLIHETKNINDDRSLNTLTIGSVDSIHNYVLNNIYQDFIHHNSNTQFRFRTHQSNEIYSLLDRKEIDIGFVLQERILKDLHVQEIFREKLVLIINNNSYKNNTINISDLELKKELYINWGLNFQIWHEKWFGTDKTFGIQIDTGILLLHLLNHEDYWAIVPSSVAKQFKKFMPIRIFPFKADPPTRSCFLAFHKTNNKQSIIQEWLTRNNNNIKEVISIDSLLS